MKICLLNMIHCELIEFSATGYYVRLFPPEKKRSLLSIQSAVLKNSPSFSTALKLKFRIKITSSPCRSFIVDNNHDT